MCKVVVGVARSVCFSQPQLLPCHQHLADCLPKDLPSRKVGGTEGRALSGPLLLASSFSV